MYHVLQSQIAVAQSKISETQTSQLARYHFCCWVILCLC